MTTTQVDEIAEGVFRLSTYVDPPGLVFNQFLLQAEEPLLFHTGMRSLFDAVTEAVQRVIPLDRLRWITFGHLEADECGSMNQWLQVAPNARIAHGTLGCLLSINDMADSQPVQLDDGQVLDLGGMRVRRIETPHVPHGWDAGLLLEESTRTLLCGDLFTATGRGPATSDRDPVGPALAAEDSFGATCLTPATAPTVRSLAQHGPATLAPMHAPAYGGDCARALDQLADGLDQRLGEQGARLSQPGVPGL